MAFHVVVPLILVRVHLHPEPQAVQPGVSGAHPRRHRLRPAHLHLRDVAPYGPGPSVGRRVVHDDRRPAGLEPGEEDVRGPRGAVGLTPHLGDDPAAVGQLGAQRVPSHVAQQGVGHEVDVLVQRVVGGLDLLFHPQEALRLREREHHLQLAEVRRVRGPPRLPVVQLHDVVVDAGQGVRLVVVPERLGVHADPLVHHGFPFHFGGDPAGGDLDELVVRIPVEERPGDEPRLERLVQQDFPVRVLGHDPVGGGVRFRAQLEPHVPEVERQRLGHDLVGREHGVLPAQRGVHRLLRPVRGRPVLAEEQPDAGRPRPVLAERQQPGQHHLLDPAVALPVGGEDHHVAVRDGGAPAAEVGHQLVAERVAHRGRLAQDDRDPDPVTPADRRQQPVLHDSAELLDLGGNRELLLVDDGRVVHVPVIEFDGRVAEAEAFGRRGDEVVEPRRRVLHREQDLRAFDPEVGDLRGDPFQLVERRRRLAAGAPLREELPGVELDGVHRGVVLPRFAASR